MALSLNITPLALTHLDDTEYSLQPSSVISRHAHLAAPTRIVKCNHGSYSPTERVDTKGRRIVDVVKCVQVDAVTLLVYRRRSVLKADLSS